MPELFAQGTWRRPVEVFLQNAWHPVVEVFKDGYWRIVETNVPPRAIQNLRLGTVTDTSIELLWDDLPNEDGYKVGFTSSTFNASRVKNATSYVRSNLNPGTTYSFWVWGYNSFGEGPKVTISATTSGSGGGGSGTAPAAPSNLTVGTVTSDSVALTWQDNSSNETGFKVFINGSAVTRPAGSTSYTASGLDPDRTYTFEVAAYNSYGHSYSNQVEATTLSEPGTPPSAGLNDWTADVDQVGNRVRALFSVNAHTESVRWRHRTNSGSWSGLQTLNVSPGQSGVATTWINGADGDRIDIELTPYTADSGGGTAGTTRTVFGTLDIGAAVTSYSATKNDAANVVAGSFYVSSTTEGAKVEYRKNGGSWLHRGGTDVIDTRFGGPEYPITSVSGVDGDTIEFRVTPYAEFDGTTLSGAGDTTPPFGQQLTLPVYDPRVTAHAATAFGGTVSSTFSVNADCVQVEVDYAVDGGGYVFLETLLTDESSVGASKTDRTTSPVSGSPGQTITIRLTPKAVNGTSGPASTDSATL